MNISVNSTNGVVTLSGQVDSAAVKAKAVEIAKNVPKVVRVVDSIQITANPPRGGVRGRDFTMAANHPRPAR
jgi:hypothetical protein